MLSSKFRSRATSLPVAPYSVLLMVLAAIQAAIPSFNSLSVMAISYE
jgi:hypothetical protein